MSHNVPGGNPADPQPQPAAPRHRVHRPSKVKVPVDWQALAREVRSKLNIPAEYRALGVRFSASAPTGNGCSRATLATVRTATPPPPSMSRPAPTSIRVASA
jgi:hypothetical protein